MFNIIGQDLETKKNAGILDLDMMLEISRRVVLALELENCKHEI
jgi:hypothetical protein